MTAVLENINKYSHLGLRRRPTYDEIIGLIGENETLTGALPDRTATQFKASQEGSFFDGLDHLEILKEEQNRIQERQLRELMLRRNLGGATYHVERFRRQREENTPPESETPSSNDDLTDAQMQTELERRARDFVDRRQQTGEAHQGLLSRSASSIMDGIFNLSPLSRTASRTQTPALQMPQPKREQGTPEMINIASDVEEVSSGEMLTAREQPPEPKSAVLRTITYRTNVGTLSEEALKFQLYIRGLDVDDLDPEMQVETRPRGSRGSGLTPKQFYKDLAQQMVQDGRWQTKIEEELMKKRIKDYRNKSRASTG